MVEPGTHPDPDEPQALTPDAVYVPEAVAEPMPPADFVAHSDAEIDAEAAVEGGEPVVDPPVASRGAASRVGRVIASGVVQGMIAVRAYPRAAVATGLSVLVLCGVLSLKSRRAPELKLPPPAHAGATNPASPDQDETEVEAIASTSSSQPPPSAALLPAEDAETIPPPTPAALEDDPELPETAPLSIDGVKQTAADLASPDLPPEIDAKAIDADAADLPLAGLAGSLLAMNDSKEEGTPAPAPAAEAPADHPSPAESKPEAAPIPAPTPAADLPPEAVPAPAPTPAELPPEAAPAPTASTPAADLPPEIAPAPAPASTPAVDLPPEAAPAPAPTPAADLPPEAAPTSKPAPKANPAPNPTPEAPAPATLPTSDPASDLPSAASLTDAADSPTPSTGPNPQESSPAPISAPPAPSSPLAPANTEPTSSPPVAELPTFEPTPVQADRTATSPADEGWAPLKHSSGPPKLDGMEMDLTDDNFDSIFGRRGESIRGASALANPTPLNAAEAAAAGAAATAAVTSEAGRDSKPSASAREDEGGMDTILHKVQPGENFWTISRTHYASGRYYKALGQANSDQFQRLQDLYVGAVIRIPPPEDLDPSLIDPPGGRSARNSDPDAPESPAPRTAASDPNRLRRGRSLSGELNLPISDPEAERVSDREDRRRPPRGYEEGDDYEEQTPRRSAPVHKIRARETLRSIARDRLGDSRRAREILDLNRDSIPDPAHLPVGQVIDLPDDAE